MSQGMAESHGSDGNDLFLTDGDSWSRAPWLKDEAQPSGGAIESSQWPVTEGAPRRKVTTYVTNTHGQKNTKHGPHHRTALARRPPARAPR